jgi:hypothetical protein
MLPTLMTGTGKRTVGWGRNALRARTKSQSPSRTVLLIARATVLRSSTMGMLIARSQPSHLLRHPPAKTTRTVASPLNA